ncbi:SprT-like family protein [Knoellia remsis]|uniref:SprT-like family protein n=1 Tax=Knoellia remsis TaxID=407159 RepID=A0A2T0UDU4_9MICO|nr:SprT-like domain-containing protein [Knoellia remsis]PRY56110.1 SprT-like family protein [Knoellia remsis]
MEIPAALALGRRLLREHGLEDWTLTTDRAKTRAGACRFATRTISISAPLTAVHDEDLVRDTLLHEIAHALVGPQHGHDATWRRTAVEIGCTGERTVDADAPKVDGPWRGECPNGHVVTRHRRPTRVMSCARCRRGFDPTLLLEWTYRGRRVPMSESYRAELDALTRSGRVPSAPSRPAYRATIGELVRIAGGTLDGSLGEVEAVFATQAQVRVDDDLYAVPLHALSPAGQLAS